jgi:elongation factor P
MKQEANIIRIGNIIEHQKRLWRVVKRAHVKPGKGGAFVQMELKDIISGTKLNERFRSGESLEKIRLDQKDYQYLYMDDQFITLMDNESYEQVQIDKDLLGEQEQFLQDGMLVTVESHEGSSVSITLPEDIILEVVETEPVVKGQTAASSNKPAVCDNGLRVMVPPFIEVGTKIVVKSADGSYVERAK